ncbi:hypothetical protein Thermo_00844 [Thermoplasmatales archaeon]|nr:hypothetical protein Thermo_00844 [Thermoplasmatales archaeon]
MGIFASMECPYRLIPQKWIREENGHTMEVNGDSKTIKREKRVEKKSGDGAGEVY